MKSFIHPQHRAIAQWFDDRLDEVEVPGPGANPIILAIINRFFPLDTDDSIRRYCAMSMSVAHETVAPGIPLPTVWDSTEGPNGDWDGPTLARTWRGTGRPIKLKDARQGDIVVFTYDEDVAGGEVHGHVGTFVSYYCWPDGTIKGVRCLGANQGNGIKMFGYTFKIVPPVPPTGEEFTYGAVLGIRRH